MKTITNGVIVKRCDNITAAQNVKKGWKYCPKSEWKKLERSNKACSGFAPADAPESQVVSGANN